MRPLRLLAALLAVGSTLGPLRAAQAPASPTYEVVLVRVVDGDTALVDVPAWSTTPFARISVRVYGVDTPESRRGAAKCDEELAAGKRASALLRAAVRPGDAMTLTYRGRDKYGGRLDGDLRLPDGRDWGRLVLDAGVARPYDGGTKSSWCPSGEGVRP